MHERKLPVTFAGMKPTIEVIRYFPSKKKQLPIRSVDIQMATSRVGAIFSRAEGTHSAVPSGQSELEIAFAISTRKTTGVMSGPAITALHEE